MFVVVGENGIICAAVRLLLSCSAGENCCWISPSFGSCVAVFHFLPGFATFENLFAILI